MQGRFTGTSPCSSQRGSDVPSPLEPPDNCVRILSNGKTRRTSRTEHGWRRSHKTRSDWLSLTPLMVMRPLLSLIDYTMRVHRMKTTLSESVVPQYN